MTHQSIYLMLSFGYSVERLKPQQCNFKKQDRNSVLKRKSNLKGLRPFWLQRLPMHADESNGHFCLCLRYV